MKPTPAQDPRPLALTVPGLAERVARGLSRLLGGETRSPDRIQWAHLGIYKAAQSHRADLGAFGMWAYWKAYHEVLDIERKERKQRRLLTAGRMAGLRLSLGQRTRAEIPADASDDARMETLAGRAVEEIVGNLLGIAAAAEEPPQAEDEGAERDAWRHAMTALLDVLGGLQTEWWEVFLLFAHGREVKAIAHQRGVDYSTLLDHFNRQLAMVRARLKAQHVHGVPRRPGDAAPALPEPDDCERRAPMAGATPARSSERNAGVNEPSHSSCGNGHA